MTTRCYIRPVGRVTAAPDALAAGSADVVRIGERGHAVFAAFELIRRHGDKSLDRLLVAPEEVRRTIEKREPGAEDLARALAGIAARRASIAGLTLDRPRLMGIVNVTPDSFSDGGSLSDARAAIDFARRLADEGAEIIDIGGESTRPGSDPVPLDEELRRVMPVIEGLAGRIAARISIDTRKAEVMRRAAASGAEVINDVSALGHDPDSLQVAVESQLPVVLMHAKGDPKTMQRDPRYDDVLLDVFDDLAERVEICVAAGISREQLIVDPGIGFGKTVAHNLALLAGLSLLHGLGTPCLLGASRKSTIGTLTGAKDPAERVPGSIAAALAGAMQGAQILRVHDVAQTRQALTVWEAAITGRSSGDVGSA